MKYDILDRYTHTAIVTAEIDCPEDAPTQIKLGFAVQCAYLSGSNLSGADLSGTYLAGANLSDAIGLPSAPVVPHIDNAILAAIEAGGTLDMADWHANDNPCGTTHCRAGWAVHLAGEAGYKLEQQLGPNAAGALIYAASRPGQPVPDFYAPNKAAMASIRSDADHAGEPS